MSRSRKTAIALVVVVAAMLIAKSVLSREPDFDTSFSREAASLAPHDILSKSLGNLAQWPAWFRDLKAASGTLSVGSSIILDIEPPGREWRRFKIVVRVTEYQPGRALRLVLVENAKLERAFHSLEWKIEILADAVPLRVRTTVHARTASPSSRLYGRIAPRILLNQVLYPDPQRLAGLEAPTASNPFLPSR